MPSISWRIAKAVEEASAVEWRRNKYDAQRPSDPEYAFAFQTILGQIYKENGDLGRAIEQWQTVVNVDQLWLQVWSEGAQFYAPVAHF